MAKRVYRDIRFYSNRPTGYPTLYISRVGHRHSLVGYDSQEFALTTFVNHDLTAEQLAEVWEQIIQDDPNWVPTKVPRSDTWLVKDSIDTKVNS